MNLQEHHSPKDVATIIATAVAKESGNVHSRVLTQKATRKRLRALITAEDLSLTERENAMLRVMSRVAVYAQTAAVASLLHELVERTRTSTRLPSTGSSPTTPNRSSPGSSPSARPTV